jgi:predicted ArsR family transcriptional regulator
MQSTRKQILDILKKEKQATVDQLSEALGLTPVTIRHHLDVLRGDGLIDEPQILRRPGPGRPQYVYQLTEAAADYFPKNYHDLADLMLDEIRDRVTPSELEQILDGVAQRLADQAPTKTAESPQEIMDTTVHFLNEKGYVAGWEKTPEGDYLLRTCNCPYKSVAHEHNEICTMDAKFVAQLVGTPPERMSRMAAGDDNCTFLFRFEKSS